MADSALAQVHAHLATVEGALAAGDLDLAADRLAAIAGSIPDAPAPVQAACRCLEARLANLQGDHQLAARQAERAVDVSLPLPVRVVAASELADARTALGDEAGALAALDDVLTEAELATIDRARLLGHRGRALLAVERRAEAATEFETARDHLLAVGDRAAALGAALEALPVLSSVDDERWGRACGLASDLAVELGDVGAAGRVLLARSSRSAAAGDLQTALDLARQARAKALEAVDPAGYVAAGTTIAAVAEATGDDVAAYSALATGYATLRDLLGPVVADASFRAALAASRERWGSERFDRARAAHDTRRSQASRDR